MVNTIRVPSIANMSYCSEFFRMFRRDSKNIIDMEMNEDVCTAFIAILIVEGSLMGLDNVVISNPSSSFMSFVDLYGMTPYLDELFNLGLTTVAQKHI